MTYDTERWHTAVEESLQNNARLVEDLREKCPACRGLIESETLSADGSGGKEYHCQQCTFGFVAQLDAEENTVESVRLLADAMDGLSDTQVERLLGRVGVEEQAFE